MLIRLGLRPRRITPSSISIILHKILSLFNYLFIYRCIFVHLPDVFEWLAISLSSFGLVLATIILLLKRRRLCHNDTRPLQVRTVICYHNGQDDVARMRHGTAAEIHPLCENDPCTSLVVRDQGQTEPFRFEFQ